MSDEKAAQYEGSNRVAVRLVLCLFGIGALVAGTLILAVFFNAPWLRDARPSQARIDLDNLSTAIEALYTEYESAPHGSNSEIMSVLWGANPRKIIFIDQLKERVSPTGEFLDPWKQPYRMDTADPAKPRIYSFGPNRRDDGGAEGSDDIVSWR